MDINIQTIKDIKPFLTTELTGIYSEPEISALAGIIIKTLLKTPRLHSLAFPESPVSQKDIHEIRRICKEIKKGKPVQYVLGETSFYNCTIKVNSETLIPRPETEELVDLVIKENRGFSGSILDIGTGSGCIAVALAVNLPGSVVTATDTSEGALIIARENAINNKARVNFIRSDIFEPEIKLFSTADIIVSNPPYIRESEKAKINRNVLDYEPHSALFVPDDTPLMFYEAILRLAGRILVNGGKVYFEVNEAMGKAMTDLLISQKFSSVELIKDINGRDRMIKAIRNG